MNRMIKTSAAVALLFAAQGVFACEYPQRINVPDGASASKDEMIAVQRGVKSYMASMEEYLTCIEADEAQRVLGLGDVDDDTKRQQEEMFNKKYNAAVEEMNLVAEEFNMQVRAYKDRNR